MIPTKIPKKQKDWKIPLGPALDEDLTDCPGYSWIVRVLDGIVVVFSDFQSHSRRVVCVP